jgi:hypothetical protein
MSHSNFTLIARSRAPGQRFIFGHGNDGPNAYRSALEPAPGQLPAWFALTFSPDLFPHGLDVEPD